MPDHIYRFLSTPSARRATQPVLLSVGIWLISIHALCEEGDTPPKILFSTIRNFYPRPLRGGRPGTRSHPGRYGEISIHALCEEGDVAVCYNVADGAYFYPRPLRGGRRRIALQSIRAGQFLSTPSARRATENKETAWTPKTISIHALCEEGDFPGLIDHH